MANVLFKKGLLSQLPTSGSNDVVDGALYFAINTTDSSNQRGKLYLGDENHNLIPIGEDVVLKAVSTMSQLPAASSHAHEFYYIEQGNILAESDGSEWHQVNTDTKLVGSNSAITVGNVSNNASEISLAIAQTDDPSNTAVGGKFSIKGGTNVTITKDGSNVVISSQDDDTHYEIDAAAGTQITESGKVRDVVEITLDDSRGASYDSTVKFKDSDSVGVNIDANGVIYFAVDTSGVGAVTDLTGGNGQAQDDGQSTSTNGFNMMIETSDTNHPSFVGNIDPQISLKNSSGTALTPIHFVNGVAALDAYATGAVDEKLANLRQTLDAMHYMGGAATLNAIKGNGLHNGDVYLATSTIPFTGESVSTGSETTAEAGYLIIVEGTENTANNTPVNGTPAGEIPPANATYTIVKAHDTDTTYTVANPSHGMTIAPTSDSTHPIGGIVLAEDAGGVIELSDSTANNINTITIKHADDIRDTSWQLTGTAQSQNAGSSKTFTGIVTGVAVTPEGHVENITLSSLTVTDTVTQVNSNVYAVSASSNVATITNTVGDNQSGSAQGTFKIASPNNTIQVTKTTDNGVDVVNLDIVWGTFSSQS